MNRRALIRGLASSGGITLVGCLGDDETEDCPTLPDEPAYGGWLENTTNYEQTCDFRLEDSLSITVGARANHAYWGFRPPAVAITPGTAVQWEWNGRGGAHDVKENNGVFDSGRPVDSTENTYEITFDSPGTYKYYCTPHRTSGMKGVVFVALE